jgi:hypothetical protein
MDEIFPSPKKDLGTCLHSPQHLISDTSLFLLYLYIKRLVRVYGHLCILKNNHVISLQNKMHSQCTPSPTQTSRPLCVSLAQPHLTSVSHWHTSLLRLTLIGLGVSHQ